VSALVLIVEDDPRSLKLARDVLNFAGFETLEAASGEEAITAAHEHPPDVVLMDIHLPGIDGVETMKALRADPATRRSHVIAVTAGRGSEDRERFLAAGFDDYVSKPIDVHALPDRIRRSGRRPDA
jgi:two-component system cell cycle response regulator DivK